MTIDDAERRRVKVSREEGEQGGGNREGVRRWSRKGRRMGELRVEQGGE